MIIRKARKGDLARLWELEIEDRKYHTKITDKKYLKLTKNKIDEAEQKDFVNSLSKSLKKKNEIILVAEKDEKIIGYIEGYLYNWDWSDYSNIKLAHINDISVAENYRRKNIGTKLLEEFEKWAESKKCFYLGLNVWINNKRAIKFYKKNKFDDYLMYMIKKI